MTLEEEKRDEIPGESAMARNGVHTCRALGFTHLLLSCALLGSVSCVSAIEGHEGWIKAENEDVVVEARSFLGSKVTAQVWERLVDDGLEPFGKKNKYFAMRIFDKRIGRRKELPMVPATFLAISPTSSLIVLLSDAYPTSGMVVVSKDGEVKYSNFDICFPSGCPIISHSLSGWFSDVGVGISFESREGMENCLIRIKSDKDDATSEELAIDICSGT